MHRHTQSEPFWLSFSTLLKPSKEHEGHIRQAGPRCTHPSELQLLWDMLSISCPKGTRSPFCFCSLGLSEK